LKIYSITLKSGVINLAETDVKDYVAEATQDGQGILIDLKTDLEGWADQVASGALSPSDFQDLLMGQKDELEMVALKDVGLAEIAVDQFKADIFNLINTTIGILIP